MSYQLSASGVKCIGFLEPSDLDLGSSVLCLCDVQLTMTRQIFVELCVNPLLRISAGYVFEAMMHWAICKGDPAGEFCSLNPAAEPLGFNKTARLVDHPFKT